MAQAPAFMAGLERVIEGAQSHRIALMCSERDPLTCHRCLLVRRALTERGARVSHVLDSGERVSHGAIEDELLARTGRAGDDLFAPRAGRLAAAYRDHARKVAFAQPAMMLSAAVRAGGSATAFRRTGCGSRPRSARDGGSPISSRSA